MLINNPTIKTILEGIAQVELVRNQPILVFISEETPIDLSKLDDSIKEVSDNIFIGFFPKDAQRQNCCYIKKIWCDDLPKSSQQTKSEFEMVNDWESIRGPYVATKVEGNTVHELNWETPIMYFIKELGYTPDLISEYSVGVLLPNGVLNIQSISDILKSGSFMLKNEISRNTVLYLLKKQELVSTSKFAISNISQNQKQRVAKAVKQKQKA